MSDARVVSTSRVYVPVLSFRAARNYLHSTDLYPELIAGAAISGWQVDGPIDIRFNRRISTQAAFHFGGSSEESEESEAVTARFSLGVGQETVVGRILATKQPVTGRRPYDERPIWTNERVRQTKSWLPIFAAPRRNRT